jgi:hypothetical protein
VLLPYLNLESAILNRLGRHSEFVKESELRRAESEDASP